MRTVIAILTSPELPYLLAYVDTAERSIDLRCRELAEPSLVASLKRASERGVTVRIVVDRVSRFLADANETGNSNLQIRVMPPQAHGRFLAPAYHSWIAVKEAPLAITRRYLRANAAEATLEVDQILYWKGVATLSPGHWVHISTAVIHTRNPDPMPGSPRFLHAWQVSKAIPRRA